MPTLVRSDSINIGLETHLNTGFSTITMGTPYSYNQNLYVGSGGHYGYPEQLGKGRDIGGEFALYGWRNISTLVPCDLRTTSQQHNLRYTGSMYVSPSGASLSRSENDGSSPNSFGATAYSKMKPAQPSFGGLNAIYELKDLPGMLRQRFYKNNLKNIGSYYLALKFGWEALLRDVRNLVLTQQEAQDILKQLLRDNGRPVRRRITLQDLTTVEFSGPTGGGYPAWYPILNTYYYRKPPTSHMTRKFQDRVWASAQFRYWLPDGPRDIIWKARMMAKIFGLNPSPSTVYNAVPWSWLVDWFTNTGDVIENLDAGVADRLAADHFYVMRERSRTVEHNSTTYMYDMNRSPIELSGNATSYAFAKRRVKGDPFGFATNENTLSGMQLSILGALGLSRLR